jgi:hypothetical protein
VIALARRAQANSTPPLPNHDELASTQFVRDGRGLHLASCAGMPERLSVAGVEYKDVAVRIAGEGHAGIRGQDPCRGRARPELVRPADLARLIVERLQHGLAGPP